MAISKIAQNQASGAANAIQVQQAFYTANAGLDWAKQQALDTTSPISLANTNGIDYSSTVLLPGGNSFTVHYKKTAGFAPADCGTIGVGALCSVAKKGDAARVMTWNNFQNEFSTGGGGPEPCLPIVALNDVKVKLAFATNPNNPTPGVFQNAQIAPFTLPPVAISGMGSIIDNPTVSGNLGIGYNYLNFTNGLNLKNKNTLTFTGPGGYTCEPTVSITGGGGIGATATATISLEGYINGITVTNSGIGYTSPPSVSFSGCGGGGAGVVAPTAVISNGAITQIILHQPQPPPPLTVYVGADVILGENTTLNINGNVLFVITGKFTSREKARINVGSKSNLLIMNTGNIVVEENAKINTANTSSNVLIMSQGMVNIDSNAAINAGIYTTSTSSSAVTIKNNATVTGGVVSAGGVVPTSRVVSQTGAGSGVLAANMTPC